MTRGEQAEEDVPSKGQDIPQLDSFLIRGVNPMQMGSSSCCEAPMATVLLPFDIKQQKAHPTRIC